MYSNEVNTEGKGESNARCQFTEKMHRILRGSICFVELKENMEHLETWKYFNVRGAKLSNVHTDREKPSPDPGSKRATEEF